MVKLKIKEQSVLYLYLLALIPLLIVVLGQFNIIDLSQYAAPTISLIVVFFVASEIGIAGMIRARKLSDDPTRVFGIIVVAFAMIAAVSELAGFQIGLLQAFGGVTNVLLMMYLVIEAFR